METLLKIIMIIALVILSLLLLFCIYLAGDSKGYDRAINDCIDCLCKVEEKVKALEIIKDKKVDMDFLFEEWEEENYEFALENYNFNHDIELTQEEYDLLKEILRK